MNKSHFFHKPNYTLTKDQSDNIIHDINITNLIRMKLILIIFIIVEGLFILFNDIPYLRNTSSNIIWNNKGYFILHILISFICIIGFVLIKVSTIYDKYKSEKIYRFLVSVLVILLLSLVAAINGLDQAIHPNMSSVFIANLFIFSSIILLRFPLNLGVYTIPFIIYISGSLIFQHDTGLLISNSINGLIYFFASILISTVIYNYHYQEIAENIVLEEINLKLNYLSDHDPLTGLLNRRSFRIRAAEKMKFITETEKPAALILMDIDHFKYINDKYGHPIGDIVLKEISHILTEHIGADDLATRWGGEEFLIFLFHTSADEAYALANNIRLAIQNKIILDDKLQMQITASFGISILKNNLSNTFDISYRAADAALYQAKNQGRNRVIIE